MLYLDSSALVKHYIQEAGTEELNARLDAQKSEFPSIFTSVLTYAEIHAVLARKMKEKALAPREFARARRKFDSDWLYGLSPIELGVGVLGFVKDLVKTYPLKGSDAIHLASALWIRDTARLSGRWGRPARTLVLATSDRQLSNAALQSEIEVFNPETTK